MSSRYPGVDEQWQQIYLAASVPVARRSGGSGRIAWGVAWIVGLALLAYGVYSLSRGMRATMAVGGSCGNDPRSGYQLPACPDGAAAGILIGIFGGLFGAGLSGVAAARGRFPQLAPLGWPALFGALGLNFLDFAADGDRTWTICGVVFLALAVLPLIGTAFHLLGRPRRR